MVIEAVNFFPPLFYRPIGQCRVTSVSDNSQPNNLGTVTAMKIPVVCQIVTIPIVERMRLKRNVLTWITCFQLQRLSPLSKPVWGASHQKPWNHLIGKIKKNGQVPATRAATRPLKWGSNWLRSTTKVEVPPRAMRMRVVKNKTWTLGQPSSILWETWYKASVLLPHQSSSSSSQSGRSLILSAPTSSLSSFSWPQFLYLKIAWPSSWNFLQVTSIARIFSMKF